MYIEFSLPGGAGGHSAAHAAHANHIINQALHDWSNRYQIPYNTKLVKHKKRITFDSDESYSLFALTWIPHSKYPSWTNFKLVVDLNNKI